MLQIQNNTDINSKIKLLFNSQNKPSKQLLKILSKVKLNNQLSSKEKLFITKKFNSSQNSNLDLPF